MNLSAHQLTMTVPSFLSTTPDERRRHEATRLRKQLRPA